MYLHCLLILLGSVAATPLAKLTSSRGGGYKIVNGVDAPEGIAPYQVSLQKDEEHVCGGSVLNKRWILTAAHCIKEGSYRVRVGSNLHNRRGELYDVDKTIVHENYNLRFYFNDIALVRVSKNIKFSEKVMPVQLPSEDTKAGLNVMLTGWGMSHKNYPVALQMINMTTVSLWECKRGISHSWPSLFMPQSIVCAFIRKGQGACFGDSGGPLVAGNVQVGVTSYNISHKGDICICAVGYPDIYTNVYSYLDWIQTQINTNSN